MLLPPRQRTTREHYRIVLAFLGGTTTGALLSAMTFWFLSGFLAPLPETLRVPVLAVGAVIVLLAKLGPLEGRVCLPEAKRQIPAEVFGRGFVPGAYRFGLELGTGLRTYVPSPAPYLLLLAILLARPPLSDTLCIALGYGLGRAVPLIIQLTPTGRQGITAGFMVGKVQFGPITASVLVLAGTVAFLR